MKGKRLQHDDTHRTTLYSAALGNLIGSVGKQLIVREPVDDKSHSLSFIVQQMH